MEQKAPAPPRRALALVVKDQSLTPHARFASCLKTYGLKDDDAAALLMVTRPVVARLRLGTREASQDLAARVEIVFGIPAADWAALRPETLRGLKASRQKVERMARDRVRKVA